MDIAEYMSKTYNFLIIELADPRTKDWFLVENPFPVFLLVIFYNFFILHIGPKFMKNKKPLQLRNTLIIYNFLQVLLSIHMFLEGFTAYLMRYNLKCQPVDFSWNEEAIRAARGCHIYYMAKLTELLDSIFFVLRKKDNQLTFLHVYHHSIMPLISWGNVKYYPGGHGVFIGMVNSFVHIFMYTYYMIAAMGREYHVYIWWKKYLTALQMIQMGLTFLHSAQLLFYDCGYPRWTVFFTMPNAILFVILFYDFYKQVYFKNREAKTEIETKSDENNNTNEVMENTQEISSPKCNGLEKDFIHKKEE